MPECQLQYKGERKLQSNQRGPLSRSLLACPSILRFQRRSAGTRLGRPPVGLTWAVRRSVRPCVAGAHNSVLTVSLNGLLDLIDHVLLARDLETDLGQVEGVGDGTGDGCSDTFLCQLLSVRCVL